MDKEKIFQKIEDTIKSLTEIKEMLKEKSIVPEIQSPEINSSENYETLESLKKALESDKWPLAVNPNLICNVNSESDKKERGIGILELIVEESIKDGKFLDYGCGEGYCAAQAKEVLGCSLSVGYDIKNPNWASVSESAIFSTSYEEVKALGPYDAILLFDVLDHVSQESPTETLKKVYDLLSPTGKVYLRCHPWMSRHGTHHYHSLNKAYVHLVFSESELQQLSDFTPEPNQKVKYPLSTYQTIIKDSGFKILHERTITEKSEPFFKIPKIKERIVKNTGHKEFPEFQMSLQFIDYKLEKSSEIQ